jgi:hypothetical protein
MGPKLSAAQAALTRKAPRVPCTNDSSAPTCTTRDQPRHSNAANPRGEICAGGAGARHPGAGRLRSCPCLTAKPPNAGRGVTLPCPHLRASLDRKKLGRVRTLSPLLPPQPTRAQITTIPEFSRGKSKTFQPLNRAFRRSTMLYTSVPRVPNRSVSEAATSLRICSVEQHSFQSRLPGRPES